MKQRVGAASLLVILAFLRVLCCRTGNPQIPPCTPCVRQTSKVDLHADRFVLAGPTQCATETLLQITLSHGFFITTAPGERLQVARELFIPTRQLPATVAVKEQEHLTFALFHQVF